MSAPLWVCLVLLVLLAVSTHARPKWSSGPSVQSEVSWSAKVHHQPTHLHQSLKDIHAAATETLHDVHDLVNVVSKKSIAKVHEVHQPRQGLNPLSFVIGSVQHSLGKPLDHLNLGLQWQLGSPLVPSTQVGGHHHSEGIYATNSDSINQASSFGSHQASNFGSHQGSNFGSHSYHDHGQHFIAPSQMNHESHFASSFEVMKGTHPAPVHHINQGSHGTSFGSDVQSSGQAQHGYHFESSGQMHHGLHFTSASQANEGSHFAASGESHHGANVASSGGVGQGGQSTLSSQTNLGFASHSASSGEISKGSHSVTSGGANHNSQSMSSESHFESSGHHRVESQSCPTCGNSANSNPNVVQHIHIELPKITVVSGSNVECSGGSDCRKTDKETISNIKESSTSNTEGTSSTMNDGEHREQTFKGNDGRDILFQEDPKDQPKSVGRDPDGIDVRFGNEQSKESTNHSNTSVNTKI